MMYIKEDGSLDIERINALKIEEYIEAMQSLTKEQLEEYLSKLPVNESNEPMQAIKVDFGFDDERSGIDINEYIALKRRNMGLISFKNNDRYDSYDS